MDIRFTSWKSSRIDVDPLEQSKPELTRRTVIAVWTTVHYRQVEFLQQLQYLARFVILRAIPYDHRAFPPVPRVLVELTHKISKEKANCTTVRIGGGQGNVALCMV